MSARWRIWFTATVILLIGGIWGLGHWSDNRYVSVQVTIRDNNYRLLLVNNMCVGLESGDNLVARLCGTTLNGSAVVGYVLKGEYKVLVWLGDFEKIDNVIYSQKINLKQKRQDVQVRLDNVTQKIEVIIAKPGFFIPQSIGNSVRVIFEK